MIGPARLGAATTTTSPAISLPSRWGGPAQPLAPPPAVAAAGPPSEALAGFWRRLGAAFLESIGNKILGVRVLDADTGRSLPYARAFVRALVSNLSALALFLGYLWMLWEPRKRTWHDIVANSQVVRTTFYPPGEFARLPR